MAFSKYAKAQVVHPLFTQKGWDEIRQAAKEPSPSFELRKATQVVLGQYDPKQYLLTHCTIVASVDTESPAGMPLGKSMVDGVQVNRLYPDFYVTPGTTKYINNNCFIPGTLVTLSDGTVKPIELVEVGDSVLTHKGRSRKVLKAYVNDHNGPMLQIKTCGTTERLQTTLEHPFYTYQHNTSCVCCGSALRRSLKTISFLLGRHYCSKECYYKTKVTNAKLLLSKTPEFIPASGLSDEDYLTAPVLKDGTDPVELTLGQARLIGLFLAEGYYGLYAYNDNEKVKPVWAFHKEEAHTLASDVTRLLRAEFGVESKVHYHSSDQGIHVDTPVNRDLVTFFSYWVKGEDSTTKTLHPALLSASREIQMEILRGWYEGDGSYVVTNHDSRLSGCTSSRSMASQIQLMLFKCGISNHLNHAVSAGRKRVVLVDGSVRVVPDDTKTCESWQVTCGAGWIGEIVQFTVYESRYAQYLSDNGGIQSVPELRFLNGYHTQKINKVDRVEYSGQVFNLEVEEDNSYIANGQIVHNCDAFERKLLLSSFRTFVGGQSYVEHIQIPELSKGRIVDAVARDIGDSVYIDILVANERKHKSLIEAITSGHLNTLSMGCSVTHTVCSKCGNVAEDETNLCVHIKYEKGNTFIDAKGQRRKVAELCGHVSVEPGSVKFIEASWVANPAFKGAVLRNILDPNKAEGTGAREKIQVAFQQPVGVVDPRNIQKAARSSKVLSGDHLVYLHEGPSIGKLKAPTANSTARIAEQTKQDRLLQISAFDDGMSQGEGQSKSEISAPESPFKKVVDDLHKTLVDEVKDRVKKELSDSEANKTRSLLDENSSNESLIKSALQYSEWRARAAVVASNVHDVKHAKSVLAGLILHSIGGWEAVRNARRLTGAEILVVDRLIGRFTKKASKAGEARVYRTVVSVGGTARYSNVNEYLTACSKVIGRTPTYSEKASLVEKGKLFSFGI